MQQLVILTPNQIGVYDLQASKLIEQVEFDASTLMTPTLGLTTNGNTTYQDSVRDISHSMRVYKGKIFLLVSNPLSGFTCQLERHIGPDGDSCRHPPDMGRQNIIPC